MWLVGGYNGLLYLGFYYWIYKLLVVVVFGVAFCVSFLCDFDGGFPCCELDCFGEVGLRVCFEIVFGVCNCVIYVT